MGQLSILRLKDRDRELQGLQHRTEPSAFPFVGGTGSLFHLVLPETPHVDRGRPSTQRDFIAFGR